MGGRGCGRAKTTSLRKLQFSPVTVQYSYSLKGGNLARRNSACFSFTFTVVFSSVPYIWGVVVNSQCFSYFFSSLEFQFHL